MRTWQRLSTALDILLARSRWKKRLPRERFLLPQEWLRLKPILDRQPTKVRVYFSILLLEGPRRDELRLAQRCHVDLIAGLWHKPTCKNGRRQLLPLSPDSCRLFAELTHLGTYFFVGETEHVVWSATAVEYWWRKIRKQAQLEDVQIRDLRRTMASWMSCHGESLIAIKEILHHSNVSTTQIYARVDQSAIRAALTRHADRVLGGGADGERP